MSSAFINYCFENRSDQPGTFRSIYSARLTSQQEHDLRTAIYNGARRLDCPCNGWGPSEKYDPGGYNHATVLNIIRTIGPLNLESMMLFLKNKITGLTDVMLLNMVTEILKQGFINQML